MLSFDSVSASDVVSLVDPTDVVSCSFAVLEVVGSSSVDVVAAEFEVKAAVSPPVDSVVPSLEVVVGGVTVVVGGVDVVLELEFVVGSVVAGRAGVVVGTTVVVGVVVIANVALVVVLSALERSSSSRMTEAS